jgi:hypothetical protein
MIHAWFNGTYLCVRRLAAVFPHAITHYFSSTWQIWRESPSTRGRSGLAQQTRGGRASTIIRSKHLSRESKQYYEHEQEYQKHVHLLTCLVYSRVKGYQQLNSQAPVIRVGVDDVHNSGQTIVNSDINRNVSAFIMDDWDMYTILQWACSFLNSFSFATDH